MHKKRNEQTCPTNEVGATQTYNTYRHTTHTQKSIRRRWRVPPLGPEAATSAARAEKRSRAFALSRNALRYMITAMTRRRQRRRRRHADNVGVGLDDMFWPRPHSANSQTQRVFGVVYGQMAATIYSTIVYVYLYTHISRVSARAGLYIRCRWASRMPFFFGTSRLVMKLMRYASAKWERWDDRNGRTIWNTI